MFDSSTLTARDIMTAEVRVVHPDTPLLKAVLEMAEHRIGGLIVVDDQYRPIGMLTEGDVLRWHGWYGDFTPQQMKWLEHLSEGTHIAADFMSAIRTQQRTVKRVMSGPVSALSPDTRVQRIGQMFYDKNIKRAPVVEDGKLVGVVSRADLVRAVARELAETPEIPELAETA